MKAALALALVSAAYPSGVAADVSEAVALSDMGDMDWSAASAGGGPTSLEAPGSSGHAAVGAPPRRLVVAVQEAFTQEKASPSRRSSPQELQKVEAAARWEAIMRSVIAGLSTSLGAAIVLLLRGAPTPGQMAFALSLAGGVMITVSLLEMWMPQLLQPGRRLDCVLGAGAGLLGFLALKNLVPEPQYGSHPKACEDMEEDCEDPAGGGAAHEYKVRQWRLAVLLTLALTAHNFPEGLAVAVSSLQSERLGFVVMAAIAVHNIPEGIAIAMPVLDATGSRYRAMQMATLSGLAEPLGAILAVTALPEYAIKGRGMDALLCAIGGIMTSVALTELLPEAQAQRRPLWTFAGLVVGAGIMLLTHELA